MRNKGKGFMKGRRQKGITLVALVVTIVVLLILAGVSIRLVLDNNGIITKAGDAKDKTYIEAIKEAKEMWDAEKYLDATSDSLADYLYNHKVITEEEKDIVSSGGTITKGNYSVSFKKTLVEAFKAGELKVGDWVNYANPTTVSADVKAKDSNYSDTGYTSPAVKTGTSAENGYDENLDQTYSLTNNGVKVNWRVLGLSEDGTQLLLTTGSPLQRDYDTGTDLSNSNNPYLQLYGAESYEYGPEELNKICAIYKNGLAAEVKSITQRDVDRLTGVTTENKIKEVNLDKYYGNKQYGDSYSYDNAYTPSSFLKGEAKATITGTIDGYYYSVNSKVADDAPSVTVSDDIYNMLFARTTYPTGKTYWLASRFVRGYSGYAYFGPGAVGIYDGVAYAGCYNVFNSDGDEGDGYGAVRPVVYLKSDVTVDDIQKIDTPTSGEEDWNYSW